MAKHTKPFEKYVYDVYDPIEVGSIDRTDTEPHDKAILRAIASEYAPNKLVKGDPEHTIFIARLNPRTTQDTIETEFSKFGKVKRCRLVKDIVTGISKKYAFLEYERKQREGLKDGNLEDLVEALVERKNLDN
ncbi:unnamed protein product [Leptosia nina]|uniref:RRM domain-containing protein n=1 Tax=Leptosia nina TaxID=320188 RepID=A0AAV1JHN2_9NEOP